jgi:uncharacterized protein (TIGR00369 family)
VSQTRTRTITWQDPGPVVQRGLALSGREYLTAMLEGSLPVAPSFELMGFRAVEVADGRITIEAEPGEWHYNAIGVVNGGFAASMLDAAMAGALHSRMSAGAGTATLTMNVSFLRPLSAATGTVRCTGSVVHLGGRTAVAQAEIVDAEGRACAIATGTNLVLAP